MGNRHSKPKNAEEPEPQFSIHGGVRGSHHTLGNVYGEIHYGSKADLFQQLRPDVVFDAFYDSAKRQDEHAVICQPETKTKVLSEVRSWADKTTTSICWLSGPAGTGKTTIAHTIAHEYDDRGKLAATFFFWRKTGDRDKIHKLVPTLAYQIAKKNSSVKEQLEKELDLEVPLSALALEHQLEKFLVLSPMVNAKTADFKLVVIDGLDECDSPELISKLIDWLHMNTYPFRILLTSRPEPHVTKCFRSPPHNAKCGTLSLSLTESKEDIRKYLIEQLGIINRMRPSRHGPSEWPSASDLNQFVEKSEGLFIYAATALLYIGGKGDPDARLMDVLRLHKGLDPLYNQVIQVARKWDYFDVVMASLVYIQERLSVNELSSILISGDGLLNSSDIRMALHGCHSILIIPDDDDTKIRFHHHSLRDFLTNKSRSETLFYAPATAHAQLMVGCLVGIMRAYRIGEVAPSYALASWHFHACMFLATTSTGIELEDIDDAESFIDNIDEEWVESWLIEALRSDKISYLNGELPSSKGKKFTDLSSRLERKTTIISDILQNLGREPATSGEKKRSVLHDIIQSSWTQLQ